MKNKNNFLRLGLLTASISVFFAVIWLIANLFFSIESDDKVNVLVTILPQKEFVNAVGGDYVNVSELVPPGAEPATYNLTTQDLVSIEKADIYFRIGYVGFEKGNMDRIVEVNQDMKVILPSENIYLRYFGDDALTEQDYIDSCNKLGGDWNWPYHECLGVDENMCDSLNGRFDECASPCRHDPDVQLCVQSCDIVCSVNIATGGLPDPENIDPHLWLSPVNVEIMIRQIQAELSSLMPENSEYFAQNADKYVQRLQDLDMELIDTFISLKGENLFVFHPAWGYFADRYGLVQVALEQEGKEPTSSYLAELIDVAKEENAKVIFIQEQFSTNLAESFAQDTGGVVVSVDPLAEDYIDNLSTVGKIISENLSD